MNRKWLAAALLAASNLVLSMPAQANTEWVRATVVKTDAARKKLTLNHEAIKSLPMEAMTMPFSVKDAALMSGLKPGDKVSFTFVNDDGELVVTAIKAAP